MPLLASLTDEQCLMLSGVVQRCVYPRGTTILRAGEPANSAYVILSGRVQVVMGNERGREVILALLGPGDHFGEMGLLDDEPRSATVVAREQCEAIVLAKEDFVRCLRQNFDMLMTVGRGLVKRLRDADNRIASLALLDVYGRVAKVLMQLSEESEDGRVISGRLSRQDIAKMVGASREMVSRVIKDLEARGYVEFRDDGIVVRSSVALVDAEPAVVPAASPAGR